MLWKINQILVKPLHLILGLWHVFISPLFGNNCRFVPTCSEYAKDCLQKYYFPKAFCLILYRLLRCNPLCKGGEDPA
ncbi:MAG: membrane protein insertion efficiency factor YidD [Proteobacteria bacterium]|nr:membrane protein insertion efficiency factor YidD [Pseudomonadota bacterium]